VSISFADDDFCPCGKGELTKDCSCKRRQFVPEAAITEPPGLRTGLRVFGCYAASMANCGGGLTQEHPVSKSVLTFLAHGGKRIRISGHSHQKRQTIDVVGISGLSPHVLCERHNRALSSLDDVAVRFIVAYEECKVHLFGGSHEEYHRLFNGFDIERWMLKVLCGKAAGGLWSVPRHQWTPPDQWLEVLFGNGSLPRLCGLYFPEKPPDRPWSGSSIYTRPLFANAHRMDPSGSPLRSAAPYTMLVGIEVTILNLCLLLYMWPPRWISGSDQNLSHRNRMIRFFDLDGSPTAFLHLGWKETPPTFKGLKGKRNEKAFSEADARIAGERLREREKANRHRAIER
jgi:hypothetical protein